MTTGTDRLFGFLRRKLNGCFVVKDKKLTYKRGKKREFDYMIEKITNLLEEAKKMNDKSIGELYEGPTLHPDCIGTDDHQNQEAMYYCPKCVNYARRLNTKVQKEKKRAIYRLKSISGNAKGQKV